MLRRRAPSDRAGGHEERGQRKRVIVLLPHAGAQGLYVWVHQANG